MTKWSKFESKGIKKPKESIAKNSQEDKKEIGKSIRPFRRSFVKSLSTLLGQ